MCYLEGKVQCGKLNRVESFGGPFSLRVIPVGGSSDEYTTGIPGCLAVVWAERHGDKEVNLCFRCPDCENDNSGLVEATLMIEDITQED
jgi:hypothetical protein